MVRRMERTRRGGEKQAGVLSRAGLVGKVTTEQRLREGEDVRRVIPEGRSFQKDELVQGPETRGSPACAGCCRGSSTAGVKGERRGETGGNSPRSRGPCSPQGRRWLLL